VISAFAGFYSDIVRADHLKTLEHKCMFIAPLEGEDPNVGKIIRDVFEKESIRHQIELCEPNTASVLFTGITF